MKFRSFLFLALTFLGAGPARAQDLASIPATLSTSTLARATDVPHLVGLLEAHVQALGSRAPTRPTTLSEALFLEARDGNLSATQNAQKLLDRGRRLPPEKDTVATLELQDELDEALERGEREAELLEEKLGLIEPEEKPQAHRITRTQLRWSRQLNAATRRLRDLVQARWEASFPEERARRKALDVAHKARLDRRQAQEEEARKRAQAEAAQLESSQKEASALAAKARGELAKASNQAEAELAQLRLRFAELKEEVATFRLKLSKTELKTTQARKELEELRGNLERTLSPLMAIGARSRRVAEARTQWKEAISALEKRIALEEQQIRLEREKIPGFRRQTKEAEAQVAELEEEYEDRRKDARFRQRVFFARQVRKLSAERLDLYRTHVESWERAIRIEEDQIELYRDARKRLAERPLVRYAGQTLETWTQFGLVLGITFFLTLFVAPIIRSLVLSFSEKTTWKGDDIAVDELALPARTLLVLAGLEIAFGGLTLGATGAKALASSLRALRAAWLGLLVWRVKNVVARLLEPGVKTSESKLDDQLYRFLVRTFNLGILGVTIVFVLEAFGFQITSLLAGLGIGGLAFALAAKDTLANLFGSIVLFMDRPFKVGNWVIIGGTEGIVEDVGIRSTRIRTFKDTVVTIPNAIVANEAAENVHSFRKRRLYFTLELRFDTPADTLEAAVQGIRQILTDHPMVLDGHYVYLTGIKASGVEVMVYCFVGTRDWGEWMGHSQDVYLRVLRFLEEVGAGLAFPTQTIELENTTRRPWGMPPG